MYMWMLKDRIIRANDLRENRQTTEVRRNWLSLFFNKTWRAVLKMFSRLYKIAASEALPPPSPPPLQPQVMNNDWYPRGST